MALSESLFAQKFGIASTDLERYLSEALGSGGDYADVYFEYQSTSSISIDESIVKSAVQGVSLGVGVRVIHGERTGYAYSDDLSPEKILRACRVASAIARGPSTVLKTGLSEGEKRNLYPVVNGHAEASLHDRVALVERADKAARAYDSRVFQVQATFIDNVRHVLIATSDGTITHDRQPLSRLGVRALARENGGAPHSGFAGGGGRIAI